MNEKEKILKLLEEILELDNETLYENENFSIFKMVERLEQNK
jgi:hypothetical protein